MTNQAVFAEMEDTLLNLACPLQIISPVIPDSIINYFRNVYKAVVVKREVPPPEHQEKIRNAVHYINDRLDYYYANKDVYEVIKPFLTQGITTGQFTCPQCGGKAWYSLNNDKTIASCGCENGCI